MDRWKLKDRRLRVYRCTRRSTATYLGRSDAQNHTK